jgi:hypothetical protein
MNTNDITKSRRQRTTRIAAGEYTATSGGRVVTISRCEWLTGAQWVARAEWDKHLYSDPLWTLADAKTVAFNMIDGQ